MFFRYYLWTSHTKFRSVFSKIWPVFDYGGFKKLRKNFKSIWYDTCRWFRLCASALVLCATSYVNPIPGGVQQTSGTITTIFSWRDPLFLLCFFFFLLLLLVFSGRIRPGGCTAAAGEEHRPHPRLKNPNRFFLGGRRSLDSVTWVELGVAECDLILGFLCLPCSGVTVVAIDFRAEWGEFSWIWVELMLCGNDN